MGPKFGAQKGNKLGFQLGPMSITKLSPNWACQMGPIHFINFLLSGMIPRFPPRMSRIAYARWAIMVTRVSASSSTAIGSHVLIIDLRTNKAYEGLRALCKD